MRHLTPTEPILSHAPGSGMPAYRGHSLTGLRGETFERVWGLLADGELTSALPPAEPFSLPVRTGDVRADVQTALGHLGPVWSFRPTMDADPAQARADLARASVLTLSLVAQAARGPDLPVVPQREVDRAATTTERFLVRWRGYADPVATRGLDTLWLLVAEAGLVAPTQVVRQVAGTGADAAACLSAAAAAVAGPLSAGAAIRSLSLLLRAEELGDPRAAVREKLARRAAGRRPVPGFDPEPGSDLEGEDGGPADWEVRAGLVHAACARADARLLELAEATEQAMVSELREHRPHRRVAANPMFWAAVLLDHLGVAPRLFGAMVVCGRTAGWSAHVLDVQRTLV